MELTAGMEFTKVATPARIADGKTLRTLYETQKEAFNQALAEKGIGLSGERALREFVAAAINTHKVLTQNPDTSNFIYVVDSNRRTIQTEIYTLLKTVPITTAAHILKEAQVAWGIPDPAPESALKH